MRLVDDEEGGATLFQGSPLVLAPDEEALRCHVEQLDRATPQQGEARVLLGAR